MRKSVWPRVSSMATSRKGGRRSACTPAPNTRLKYTAVSVSQAQPSAASPQRSRSSRYVSIAPTVAAPTPAGPAAEAASAAAGSSASATRPLCAKDSAVKRVGTSAPALPSIAHRGAAARRRRCRRAAPPRPGAAACHARARAPRRRAREAAQQAWRGRCVPRASLVHPPARSDRGTARPELASEARQGESRPVRSANCCLVFTGFRRG